MQIYLVRHPQTTGDSNIHYYGSTDLELSERGRRQLDALVGRLRDVPLDAVFSSTLRRASQTARAIAVSHSITHTEVPAFDELDFGIWEGLSNEQIQARDPELYAQWLVRDGTFRYPEGDSVAGFRTRVLRGLETVTGCGPDSTVLVAAHAGTNRVLLTAMMGTGWEGFWSMAMDLASVTRIEYDGIHFTLALLNDTCHLEP